MPRGITSGMTTPRIFDRRLAPEGQCIGGPGSGPGRVKRRVGETHRALETARKPARSRRLSPEGQPLDQVGELAGQEDRAGPVVIHVVDAETDQDQGPQEKRDLVVHGSAPGPACCLPDMPEAGQGRKG